MRWRVLLGVVLAAGLVLGPCVAQQQPTPSWLVVVSPDNAFGFQFLHAGQPWLKCEPVAWGPNWAWRGFGAKARGKGGVLEVTAPFESNKEAGEIISVTQKVSASGPRSVVFNFTLTAAKAVPLTALVSSFATEQAARDGEVILRSAAGQETRRPLSFAGIAGIDAVNRITLDSKAAGQVTMDLEPAAPIRFDNGLRLCLAEQNFPAGTRTLRVTMTFPEPVALLVSDEDLARYTKVVPTADWFPFTPTRDLGPSVVGFENWLDKPAGRHGGVRMVGEGFQFADGTPVKFFGTNLSYALSAPQKGDAAFLAQRFAKWGVNAVRMHKFTNPNGWEGIGDPDDMTKMHPDGLDRLDNFTAELTKAGVYYGWSHSFQVHIRPGNKGRLLAYDELMDKLKGNTYAIINFAPDLQDLMIEMVVNLLRHPNPYTGKTYAQDPALAYIELQNEDDIFFYTSENAVNACPTYKAFFTKRWCQWLKAKYGSTAALKRAWGDALGGGESLEAGNIALQGNPWFMGDDNLPKQAAGAKQRLLDNAAHLHDLQNQFYTRFAKAIRDAGYQGPLCGSPWQAPAMLPHYYNLRSDAAVGYIDRHNYFGDKLEDTMLRAPGSGYFSSGLQQVAGRPFGLSEWITVYPALYSADGPPMIAAYGLGLQGWDASYEFQSEGGQTAWRRDAGSPPFGVWNVDTPTQLGQYPALARMVARGDVKTGDVIATRRVSPQGLATGTFDFTDKVQQSGDVKSFGGAVPAAALAAGRCLVEFTEQPRPSTFADMAKYTQGDVITSTTGELAWNAKAGYFTINTAGTKGVVGFAQGQEQTLGSAKLRLDCAYASLLITALEPKATLANAATALVTAVARNANTRFTVFSVDQRVLDNGVAPLLLEPVKASINLGRPIAAVNLLDHDGKRTGRTIPVNGTSFEIDGARDKTLYYEVVFAK